MTTITMPYEARVRAFNLRHLRRAADDSDLRSLLFSLNYGRLIAERECHERIGVHRTWTLLAAGLLRRTKRLEPLGVVLFERADGEMWERFVARAADACACEQYMWGLADHYPPEYVTLRIPTTLAHASSRGWSWCAADGGYYDDVSLSRYRVLRRFCVSVEARDGLTYVRVPYGYAAMIGLDWATEEGGDA